MVHARFSCFYTRLLLKDVCPTTQNNLFKEIATQYSLSRKIRTLVLLVHVAITRKIDEITINEVRINNDA